MTVNGECEKLDAFLVDDLDAFAAARFQAHLRECAACREAIEEQRWIDRLLRSPTGAQLEFAPPTIFESHHSSATRARRRRRLTACGFAAAAMLLVAAGWIVGLSRHAYRVTADGDVNVAVAPVSDVPPAETPRATFISSGDAIAVPLESPAADVSVVQLFPTTDTELRWRSELALQITYTEPNGG